MQKPSVEKGHPTEPSVNQYFPPAPPDTLLHRKIIDGFCKATAPTKFEEVGCAVCGSLTLQTNKLSTELIMELDGNVIVTSCQYICVDCKKKVRCGKLPKFALARGLWLGEIPKELQQLSFAKKLLIGRVRHNCCVVHVAKACTKCLQML